MEISFTEENYLKAIYKIKGDQSGQTVSTTQLSALLQNKAASVTDMLKRLSDKKLIRYEKYKGVELTSKGEKHALKVIRKHRLWEVFLLDKLQFGWDQVHDMAEQLEHIQSDELIERLDVFLGHPKFDPHGDPIPDADGNMNTGKSRPLTAFGKKGRYSFSGVNEHSGEFLRYLTSIGLSLGDVIHVESINSFDRTYSVKLHRQNYFFSEAVASNLLVEVVK